ncbi:hypothetical protein IVB18_44020 [Bradyrhizobium sp. 186]|uniref:hypothetical protein n=1 Tax=Bradyrhizobium sp. 186 TaxID=2782654 RepID=UPI0020009D03|nr:hypothetical protein [Bradyrhizobium sp. 186]UPK40742.1 hypothetical protein IVB18_44020 [Bradyrhizobium sp. 186]
MQSAPILNIRHETKKPISATTMDWRWKSSVRPYIDPAVVKSGDTARVRSLLESALASLKRR